MTPATLAFPLQALLTLCVLVCQPVAVRPDQEYTTIRDKIRIDFSKAIHKCSQRFLSLALGFGIIVSNFRAFNFSSKRMQNLASALSPSVIRIGGSRADFLTFKLVAEPKPKPRPKPKEKRAPHSETFQPFVMSGKQWLDLTSFCKLVGWDVVFDLNIMWRAGRRWNSSNANMLLEFSDKNKIEIESLQIGNEVNSYRHNYNMTIEPETLVRDMQDLKKLLSKFPMYKNTTVIGPEVTRLCKKSSADYMDRFLQRDGCSVVSSLTFHHYFMDGNLAQPLDFLDVPLMDTLVESLDEARMLKRRYRCRLPVRITETATCWGGGSGNVSRRYAAGFMWLDKLGQAAQYKIELLNRQTFFGGYYGLVSQDPPGPTPGYFLSVLFKRLIEGPVFNVATDRADLRVYAHCARNLLYEAGAVVIYFLNVRNERRILSLTQFENDKKDIYLFTPGDDDGLVSKFVKLNDVVLLMNDTNLPPMPPMRVSGDVAVEARTYGFIVVPEANQTLCVDYFKSRYPPTSGTGTAASENPTMHSDAHSGATSGMDPITNLITDPITNLITDAITDPGTDMVTHPDVNSNATGGTSPITKRTTHSITHRITDPITHPITNPVTDPDTHPGTDSITDPITKSKTTSNTVVHRTDKNCSPSKRFSSLWLLVSYRLSLIF